MSKNSRDFVIWLQFIVIVSLLILRAGATAREGHPAPIVKEVPMSIANLQSYLNRQGHSRYRCTVDGKYGPETAQALENYLCDREASKHFPKQEKPKNLEKL